MKSANRACRPFSIDAIGPAIQITKLNQTALQTLGLVSLAALCKPDIRSCLRCLRLRRTFFTLCIILKAKFFAVLRIFLLLLNRQYICPFFALFLNHIFIYDQSGDAHLSSAALLHGNQRGLSIPAIELHMGVVHFPVAALVRDVIVAVSKGI